MRSLTILFTTEDEIFFVNEAKELEFYRENGDGESLFKELFGNEETLENWSSDQFSEMVSNGLYVDSVKLFKLWLDTKLFDQHPELFEYVEIDKCFGELVSNGNSQSVLAFVDVLLGLEAKKHLKNYEYAFKCFAIYHKLKKKEAIEKEAIHATWRAEYEERLLKQARQLERVLSIQPTIDLGFTFEPRIELQNKKAS